jgi:hypothetical protein
LQTKEELGIEFPDLCVFEIILNSTGWLRGQCELEHSPSMASVLFSDITGIDTYEW